MKFNYRLNPKSDSTLQKKFSNGSTVGAVKPSKGHPHSMGMYSLQEKIYENSTAIRIISKGKIFGSE